MQRVPVLFYQTVQQPQNTRLLEVLSVEEYLLKGRENHFQNLFEQMRELRWMWVITYDIEWFLPKDRLSENTAKVTYVSRHKLLSVSVCFNMPRHNTLLCFIRHKTVQELACYADKLHTCRFECVL